MTLGPLHATAATPQVGEQTTSPDLALDEIIVTAQRRDESLSKTPIAVAIVSGKELEEAQIISEQDLRTATPGLSVRSNLNSNQLNYALRGQSQDAYSNTRPGVLPYINEVQISGSTGSTAFYDLQSVQVLKGPQGTLFGRSATGGAVLFTTAKPTDEFGGYVSGLGGNYGAYKIEGALNVPLISDRLLLRIAGFDQQRDGFQYNTINNRDVGGLKREGGRLSLFAKLGDNFHNDLVVDYFHSNSESSVGVLSGLVPYNPPGSPGNPSGTNPPFIPLELLYAGVATPQARQIGIGTLQAFTGAPASAAAAFYDAYFANPLHPVGGVTAFLAAQNARGPFVISSTADNIYRANNIVTTDIATLEVTPDLSIRNIFGFTLLRAFIAGEAAGTPYAIAQTTPGDGQETRSHQISEELQLQGKTAGDRLLYTTGVYVSDENLNDRQNVSFFDVIFGGQHQVNHSYKTSKTYAGYGQGTYRLNDNGLAFTLGARYTSEHLGISILPDDSNRIELGEPAPAGYDYNQSSTYNRLSWQTGLQQQLTSNLLLYVDSRRAYKSGGYNSTVAPRVGFATTGGNAYDAERVTDVELGAKFNGVVANIPVRANLAIFHNWLVNSQRTAYTLVLGLPATVTTNVPAGTVNGIELDTEVTPVRWLHLGGSINYTHAEFTDGNVIANGSPENYDQFPDSPRVSEAVFAETTVPVTGDLSVITHGDFYYQTQSFSSPRSSNNFGTLLPSYGLANFWLGLQDSRRGWSVIANVKNAFNKVYYGGALPTGEIAQYNTRTPADPRTFTVEARLKF